ncbi:hypothetical protein DESUT3_14260 [Desulfuromonas versatilis]|uniref:CO weal-nitrogenase n=1 Tax=Desulfuromonas versatilis TaxID=2802975 RepID=A0ABN6DX26_9BACT|nr:N(2)-fixation sustaining protein CowN [Desulfuromonas versatilis]BCR04357.1 hypothetical protein DESUT3_14260 [Desulfuromonas versatilis]
MQPAEKKTDRYKTFIGIDCEGNSKRLMAMLRRHIDDPGKSNPFWEKFKEKLDQIAQGTPVNGRQLDELFLIHSYINNIHDFFEEQDDQEALLLLRQVEEECC